MHMPVTATGHDKVLAWLTRWLKPEEQQQSSEPEPDTDADRRLGAGGVLSLQVCTPPHPPSRVFHTRVSLAHRNVSGVIAIVRGGELTLTLAF
jgi:hypothetical protein